MDSDQSRPRKRRWSKDSPVDFSLKTLQSTSELLSLYEQQRQRLVDIIHELQKVPFEIQRTKAAAAADGGTAVRGWALFGAALGSAAALFSGNPALCALGVAVAGVAVAAALITAWTRRDGTRAEETERRGQSLREEFRGVLSSLMDQLEQLERNVKDLRLQETDVSRRRTLHYFQMNLPDAKFSINNLHLLLVRMGESSALGDSEGSEVIKGLQGTLRDLDEFVCCVHRLQDELLSFKHDPQDTVDAAESETESI